MLYLYRKVKLWQKLYSCIFGIASLQGEKLMEFSIIGNQFVRNGKPIKIISGAVHYFRNMPDTWDDIFDKMRALG